MLLELPSDMNSMAKTPSAGHSCNINPDGKKLPEDRAQPFHHLIVKLLYLFMCTRQDIQTVVAFVSTRVKKPDEDNYKTQEFMQCIRGTRELTLTIAKQRPKVVGAEFICSPP